jgi:Ser/Thr protein kinase RdoA (MazF antagonist)
MTDVLTPFATMPAWLIGACDATRMTGALTTEVPEFASGQLRLLSVAPTGARLKERRWTVRYELVVADRDGEPGPVSLLGTIVLPSRAPSPAIGPEVGFGASGWGQRLVDPPVDLALAPADEDLPTLPLLTDPVRSRSLLESAITARVSGGTGFRIASCVPEVLRYSRGSRCTVRYRLGYDADRSPDWPDVVIAKTYRGGKGRVAWDGMRALWNTDLAAGDVVRVAEPLAFLPDENVLIQRALPEQRTLKQLVVAAVRAGTAVARAELESVIVRVADGLVALHQSGATATTEATWQEELAEVRGVCARLGDAVPALAGAADPLLAALEARAASPSDEPVPSHRSFRPAQVLLAGDQMSFIDFDGFCRAEPALDIALFRSTLRDLALGELSDRDTPSLDALRRRADDVDALCETFIARYQSRRPVSRERVALWEALDLLTVVLHSWTKVKPARLRHALVLLADHVERHELLPGGADR